MANYGKYDPKKKILFKEGDIILYPRHENKGTLVELVAKNTISELEKNYDLDMTVNKDYYFEYLNPNIGTSRETEEDLKNVPYKETNNNKNLSKEKTDPTKEIPSPDKNKPIEKIKGDNQLKKIGYACQSLREVVGLLNSGEYTEKVSINLNHSTAQKDQNLINNSKRVFNTKVVSVQMNGNNSMSPLYMSGLKNPFGHMMGGRNVTASMNIVTNDPNTIINVLSMFRSNSIYDVANNMLETARGILNGKKAIVPDMAVTREALRSESYDNFSQKSIQALRVARQSMKSELFIKFLEEQFKTVSKTGVIEDLFYDHPEPMVVYNPFYNAFGYKSFVPTHASVSSMSGSPGYISIVLNISWVDTRYAMKEALRYKKNTDDAFVEKSIAWYNTIDKSDIEDYEEGTNGGKIVNNPKYEERLKKKDMNERMLKETMSNTGTIMSCAPILAAYAINRFKEALEIKLKYLGNNLDDNSTDDDKEFYVENILREQTEKNERLPGINTGVNWTTAVGQAGGNLVAGVGFSVLASKLIKQGAGSVLNRFVGLGILADVGGPLALNIITDLWNNSGKLSNNREENMAILDSKGGTEYKIKPFQTLGANNIPKSINDFEDFTESKTAYLIPINIPQLMGQEYVNFILEIMDCYDNLPKLDAKIKSWCENAKQFLSMESRINVLSLTGFPSAYTTNVLNDPYSNTAFFKMNTTKLQNGRSLQFIVLANSKIENNFNPSVSNEQNRKSSTKEALEAMRKEIGNLNTDKNNEAETIDKMCEGILYKIGINGRKMAGTLEDVPVTQILQYFDNISTYDRSFYRAAAFSNITLNGLHELVVFLPALEENYVKFLNLIEPEKQILLQKNIIKFRRLIGFNIKNYKKENIGKILKRCKTLIAYGNHYKNLNKDEVEINDTLFVLSRLLISEFLKHTYTNKFSEYLTGKKTNSVSINSTDTNKFSEYLTGKKTNSVSINSTDTVFYKSFIKPYKREDWAGIISNSFGESLREFLTLGNAIVNGIGIISLFLTGSWIVVAVIAVISIFIGIIPTLVEGFANFLIKNIDGTGSTTQIGNIFKTMETPVVGNSILFKLASNIYEDQLSYKPNEIFPPDIIPSDGLSHIEDADTHLTIPLRYYRNKKKTLHPGFWIWVMKDAQLNDLLNNAKNVLFLNQENKIDSMYPKSTDDIEKLAEASSNIFDNENRPGDNNRIFDFMKRVIGLTFISLIEKYARTASNENDKYNCLNDGKKLKTLLTQTHTTATAILNSVFTQGTGNQSNLINGKNSTLFSGAHSYLDGHIEFDLTALEWVSTNLKSSEPIVIPEDSKKNRQQGGLFFKMKLHIPKLYEMIIGHEKSEILSKYKGNVPVDYFPSTQALIDCVKNGQLFLNDNLNFISSSIEELTIIGPQEDLQTKMVQMYKNLNLKYDGDVTNPRVITLGDIIRENNKSDAVVAEIAQSVSAKFKSRSVLDFNGMILQNMFKGDLDNEDSIGKLFSLKLNSKTAAREMAKRNITKNSLGSLRLKRQFLQTNTGAFGTQGIDLIGNRFTEILNKESRNAFGEKGSKMNPTYKLYFLQENKREWLMLDDYYSYSGVESFSVYSSVETPMQTAEIVLSNFTMNLSNMFADRIHRENPFFYSSDMNSQVNSMMLKPGCKLKIYMGYGTVLTEWDCVFAGEIADMQGEEYKKITCTSYGSLLMESYAQDNAVKMGYSYFALEDQKNVYSLQSYMLRKMLVSQFIKNNDGKTNGRLSENGQLGSSSFESDTFEPGFDGGIRSLITGVEIATFFQFFNTIGTINIAESLGIEGHKVIRGLKENSIATNTISENIRIWNTPINETYFALGNKILSNGVVDLNKGPLADVKKELKRNIFYEGDITTLRGFGQRILNLNKYLSIGFYTDIYDATVNYFKVAVSGEYKETDTFIAHNETYWETIQEMLLQLPNHVCTVRPFDERNTLVITDKVRGYYRFTRKVFATEILTNNIISELENEKGIQLASIDFVMDNILREDNDSIALFIMFYIYAGRALSYYNSSSSGRTYFEIPTELQIRFVVDKLNETLTGSTINNSIDGINAEIDSLNEKIELYKRTYKNTSLSDSVNKEYNRNVEKKKKLLKQIETAKTQDYSKNVKNENPTIVARRRLLTMMFSEKVHIDLIDASDKDFLEAVTLCGKNYTLIDNNIDAFTQTKDGSISNEILNTPLEETEYNNYAAGSAIMEACGNVITWALSNAYMRSSSHRKLSENHYKSTKTDIISNEINLGKAFNNVEMTLVEDPKDYEDIIMGNKEGVTNEYRTSVNLRYLNTYKTFVKNGYSEETVDRKRANHSMGVNILANVLKETYNGQIVLLGDSSIKEWDVITIYDQMNDMYGFFEVKSVTHIYSKQSGFVTVVTPQLPTYNDFAIQSGPERSGWEYIGGALKLLALGTGIVFFGPKVAKKLINAGKSVGNMPMMKRVFEDGAVNRAKAYANGLEQKIGPGTTGYRLLTKPFTTTMHFLASNKGTLKILEWMDSKYLSAKMANLAENISALDDPMIATFKDAPNIKAFDDILVKLKETPGLSTEQINKIESIRKDLSDNMIKILYDKLVKESGIDSIKIKELDAFGEYIHGDEFKNLDSSKKTKAFLDAMEKHYKQIGDKGNEVLTANKDKVLEAMNAEYKKFLNDAQVKIKTIITEKPKAKVSSVITDEQKKTVKEANDLIDANQKEIDRLNISASEESPLVEKLRSKITAMESMLSKLDINSNEAKELKEGIESLNSSILDANKIYREVVLENIKEIELKNFNLQKEIDKILPPSGDEVVANAEDLTKEILAEINPNSEKLLFKDSDLTSIDSSKMKPKGLKLDDATPEEIIELKRAHVQAQRDSVIGNSFEENMGLDVDISKIPDDAVVGHLTQKRYENMVEQVKREGIGNGAYFAKNVIGIDPTDGKIKTAGKIILNTQTAGLLGAAATGGLWSLYNGLIDNVSNGFTGLVSNYYGQNAVTISGLMKKGEPFIANLDGMQKKNFKLAQFSNPLDIGRARFNRGIDLIKEEFEASTEFMREKDFIVDQQQFEVNIKPTVRTE